MTFDEVLRDIRGLRGIVIPSVKPGAEITIEDVSEERIRIRTTSGDIKSRPTAELRQVWEALSRKPAVHVDSELGGSGSSRNQPETIFANLPYVEVIYLQRKKHLTLGEPSHRAGTVREASLQRRMDVERELRTANETASISAVVLTSEVLQTSRAVESLTGVAPTAAEPGEYIAKSGDSIIVIKTIAKGTGSPPGGTYIISTDRTTTACAGVSIHICGRRYLATNLHGLNVLLLRE